MKNKFLSEMDTSGVIRYVKPPLITISGAPGSGKTELARELSRQLGIFLLSNDYIRNSLYKEFLIESEQEGLAVQTCVCKTNMERMAKLLFRRIPFVFDADVNSLSMYKKFELIAKFFRYELIKIRIESSGNEENLRRIQGRVLNLEDRDPSIIGDNMRYSGSYSEEDYRNILLRKSEVLPRSYFDYYLCNIRDYSFFLDEINSVINDMNAKILTRV